MGNLYVYGCSFSYGTLINIKEIAVNMPFYQNQFKHHYWGEQLANYYDMNLVCRALGGGSNETTISRVLEDSSNFSKGDKVIIGITKGSRYSLEPFRAQDRNEIMENGGNPAQLDDVNLKENAFSDINDGIMCEYFRREEAGEIEEHTEQFKRTFFQSKSLRDFGDDELGLIFHWFNTWRSLKNDVYEDFYSKMMQGLMGLLYRSGVEVYVWNWDIWGQFETITEWLESRLNVDQRMKDGHWSPNGNTAFAAFAISQIKQGVGYWTSNSVKSYKKVLNHHVFSKLRYYVESNFEVDYSWYKDSQYENGMLVEGYKDKEFPWVKNREDIYKYATSGPK